MGLMSFVKKQFVDVIEWVEDGDGVLAWRYPFQDQEIQNGGVLTVRESQVALFVNEGQIADVFGPGRYTLSTKTLPILTYLKNWDKAFASPFKSDVYFFSTRQQLDQRWGTSQPVTIRDAEFGAVRLRAFGNFAYRIVDPKVFYTEVSGTRDTYTVQDIDGQLRALLLQTISEAVASSGIPFLDLAANQTRFAKVLQETALPAFLKYGLQVEGVTLQNISLPDELQKILDQKIGLGMVGRDLDQFVKYQTAQAIPMMASGSAAGGMAGDAMGLGAGVALGQILANNLQAGLQPTPTTEPLPAPVATTPIAPDEIIATIEKLAALHSKGILTQTEFDTKKTELLKKLV